jgi:hypothetical protein
MHRPLVSKNNDVQKAKVTLVSLGAAGEKGGVYLRIVRMYSYDTTYVRTSWWSSGTYSAGPGSYLMLKLMLSTYL